MTTTAEYMLPIPYDHLQFSRATRKPKAKGDRNGETMKPVVQMLSCNVYEADLPTTREAYSYLTRLEMEGV